MIRPVSLPTLGYFKNKNGWLGSAGILRFQIETPSDQGDVTVALWQGPFSRPYAQELGRATFPLDEAGLAALADFLTAKARELEQTPAFTAAETTAYYQAKKREEQTPQAGE